MTMQGEALPSRSKAARVVALTLGLLLVVTMWSLLKASAAGTNAGAAQVTDPSNNQALSSGGSSTDFTLKLPSGAACTGDSATGQYKVQSYMVPSTVDPSTLQFGSGGPLDPMTNTAHTGANFHEPLFDHVSQSPYVNAQTANATTPGGPGPIINIPTFNYAVYSPGDIPAGTYNIGIACTLGPASTTQEDKFWNVQVTFTTDSNDSPAHIHWAVVTTGGTTTTTTGGTTTTTTGGTTTTTRATTTTTTGGTTTTTTGGTTTTTRATTTTTTGGTTTTTGGTTTTTTGGTTTTTTIGPPTIRGLGHAIRCQVIETQIVAVQNALNSNPPPPPAAQRFLTRWLQRLQKRAAKMHCDNTPPPSGSVFAASSPAQAVPMQTAASPFPARRGRWW